MCGIAGELNFSVPPNGTAVEAMAARLAHRGPDAQGFWQEGPLALGHRRLSIIDLSEVSNQPLADVTGSVRIVFNGEIYNYRELRRELERAGARFATRGDTEVIVEAYKRWGRAAVGRLNGMFAFALWDAPRQRLLLARDRLGEKPLYYQELAGGGLIFASELDALRLHPACSRSLDPEAIGQFLSLNYSLRPILAGVSRLPPAHTVEASPQGVARPAPYWDLAAAFRRKQRFADEVEAARELDRRIDEAVRLRLVSDVPLGAFLSGGVDSSILVESMARLRPPEQNRTFSIGFSEDSYNELPKARRVADHLRLAHADRLVTADMARLLPEMVRAAGEPFADSSIVPTYYLAGFARQGVKVCLSGDGADEIFAGYPTYAADRLHTRLSWLPGGVAAAISRGLDRWWPVRFDKVSLDYRLRRFAGGLDLPPERAHHHWRAIFTPREKAALLQPRWAELAACDGFEVLSDHLDAVADCDFLDRVMYADIKTWLAEDILVKVDRATMAHSLESRAPFLDHELVEFVASLPVELKMKGRRQKHLLKRSRRDRLPPGHLEQRKEGFGAPVSHWLLGALAAVARPATLAPPLAEWVRPEAVERLWQEHRERRHDHSYRLFGLACLGLWLTEAA